MSKREKCNAILDRLDESQLAQSFVLLQEAEDDAYCEQLCRHYLDDDDPDRDAEFTLEESEDGLVWHEVPYHPSPKNESH